MAVKLIRQYTVFVPNSPGALCKFVEIFNKAGLNIIGIASEVRDDSGVVRIALDEDTHASKVITDAGFTTIETFMLSYEYPADRPGNLFRLTQILNKHGLNITTVYGTSLIGDKGRIIFNVPDAEKAISIIEKELKD